MKIKKYFFMFLFNCLILSCTTIKKTEFNSNSFESRLNYAVANSELRAEKNKEQFEKLLIAQNRVNEYSDDLLKKLNENGYVEVDINRLYGIEIEKIYTREILDIKFELFETLPRMFEIDNVKYTLNYLCKSNLNYPNIYTEVYVYDSSRKNIRVFCKVNYELEYYDIQVGDIVYRVFI